MERLARVAMTAVRALLTLGRAADAQEANLNFLPWEKSYAARGHARHDHRWAGRRLQSVPHAAVPVARTGCRIGSRPQHLVHAQVPR